MKVRVRHAYSTPVLWLLAACSNDGGATRPAAADGSTAGAQMENGGAAVITMNGGAAGAATGTGGAVGAGGSSQGGRGGAGGTLDRPDGGVTVGPAADAGAAKYAGMTSIFDGTTLGGWIQSQAGLWTVMNGAIHGNGTARGYLYTTTDYEDFRVILTVRHLASTNDHQPCVLIWGQRPPPALDALGAIQFQVPNGGSWDYRPGKNNAGDGLFVHFTHPRLDASKWHQCEILAHTNGKARMACCTVDAASACTGEEFLDFNDQTAARKGPFALQVHNAGLHDEYKDIYIETNPMVDDLVTLKW